MMDLAGLKELSIPEGVVHRIRSGAVVLWEKYKNWVPYSINADGTIYNTTGYKTGYRIRSGGAESETTNTVCTGFIPLKPGDTLRIYPAFTGLNTDNAINFSNADFTNLGQIVDTGTGYGICAANSSIYKTQVVDGASTLTLDSRHDASIRYVRITHNIETLDNDPKKMIVTVFEGKAAISFVSYSGDYSLLGEYDIDGAAHNIYQFTSSGTLTLNGSGEAKVWMCGGGRHGGAARKVTYNSTSDRNVYGGIGGNGGRTNSFSITEGGNFALVIGAADGDTSFTYGDIVHTTSHTDNIVGSPGGSNRIINLYPSELRYDFSYGGTSGKSDYKSTIPFGIASLGKHSAGGCGGSIRYIIDGANCVSLGRLGASNGAASSTATGSSAAEKGGGNSSGYAGGDATFYGSGGGGGSARNLDLTNFEETGECNWSSISLYTYGDGYQGVAYVAIPVST